MGASFWRLWGFDLVGDLYIWSCRILLYDLICVLETCVFWDVRLVSWIHMWSYDLVWYMICAIYIILWSCLCDICDGNVGNIYICFVKCRDLEETEKTVIMQPLCRLLAVGKRLTDGKGDTWRPAVQSGNSWVTIWSLCRLLADGKGLAKA